MALSVELYVQGCRYTIYMPASTLIAFGIFGIILYIYI